MKNKWNAFLLRCRALGWKKLTLYAILTVLTGALLYALIHAAFLQAIPELWPVLRSGKQEDIAVYLGSQSPLFGILCTAILAFLQPISIILPGAPIQIAAGVVYGTLKGFLICHSSYVCANFTVFYFARVLRGRMEGHMGRFSKKLRFLEREKHPAYMTALACLTPLLPNGIIPYAAARTRLRLREFTLAVVMGSFFPILTMCAVGKQLLEGDYLYAGGLLLGNYLIVFLLTKYRNQVCGFLHPIGQRILALLQRADELPEEEAELPEDPL